VVKAGTALGRTADERLQLGNANARLVNAGKAEVARKAAVHIDDAIKVLVDLMKNAKRGGVRRNAAVALLRFASESEALVDERTQVFVLATGSDTAGLADRLRKRLRSDEGG